MNDAQVFALVALGALGIAAWLVVQIARMKPAIAKVEADLFERGARYQEAINHAVERRVEIASEYVKTAQRKLRTPVQGPPEAEAPLPDEAERESYTLTEEEEARREAIAAQFATHQDGQLRRDEVNIE